MKISNLKVVLLGAVLCSQLIFGQDSSGIRRVASIGEENWGRPRTIAVRGEMGATATYQSGVKIFSLEGGGLVYLSEIDIPTAISVYSVDSLLIVNDGVKTIRIFTFDEAPQLIAEIIEDEDPPLVYNTPAPIIGFENFILQQETIAGDSIDVKIYDLNDPRDPSIVGEFAIIPEGRNRGAPFKAVYFDETLLIVCTNIDLLLYDISDFEDVTLLSSVEVQELRDAVRVGDRMYCVNLGDLYTVDIEDPENPEIIDDDVRRGGGNDICFANEMLYVLQRRDDDSFRLSIININNPDRPEPVSFGETTVSKVPGLRGLTMLYPSINVQGDLALIGLEFGLSSIDISDPEELFDIMIDAQFVRLSRVIQVYGVFARDNFLYSIEERYQFGLMLRMELVIYNIENPTQPIEMGSIGCMNMSPGNYTPQMGFRNNVCYILGTIEERGFNKLVLKDISNPVEPEHIRYYEDQDDMLEGIEFAIGEQHLFIYQIAGRDRNEQIVIIDDSDPENIITSGVIDLPEREANSFYHLNVIGENPLVLVNRELLIVYSIEDIDNPEVLSSTRIEGARNFHIDGDIARVVGHDWIATVDLNNLEEPEILGVVRNDFVFYETGDDIIIDTRDAGINLWDFSDPEDAELMGFYTDYPFRTIKHKLKNPKSRISNHLFIPNYHRIDIYDVSGAMGIPVPPEWTRIPNAITTTETDTIEFEVSAWDANNEEIQLSMRRVDLAENATFEDFGNGTGIFRWETGFEDSGFYQPEFVATAGEDEAVQVVSIEILNRNRAPNLVQPLADVVLAEDPGETTFARLDTIFSDPDGDNLRYFVSGAPEELNMFAMGNSLRVRPRTNYNLPEGVEIVLTCIDPDSAFVRDTLRVTLTPVNDAPAQFNLIAPRNRSVVVDFQSDFVWQNSTDVEGDTLDYQLMMEISHGEIDSIFSWGSERDTIYNLHQIDSLMINLGILTRLDATWWVEVSDGELSAESSTRRFLTIPEVLSANNSQVEIPTEFSLGSTFPNPFNLKTVIHYALPKQAGIRIDVFSITGSHVLTIMDTNQKPGFHSVIWSAGNLESGMYFIHMQTPDYSAVNKVIFLK